MKTLAILFSLLLALSSPAYSFSEWGESWALADQGVGAPRVSEPDYVPYSISVREGKDSVGTAMKFKIYTSTGDYAGSEITNGISAVMTPSDVVQTSTVLFTNCQALVPGNYYKVAVLSNGTVGISINGSNYQTGSVAATYDTFPSTVSGSESTAAPFVFQVKNAAGQILLSNGDMTETSNPNFSGNTMYYSKAGNICATL